MKKFLFLLSTLVLLLSFQSVSFAAFSDATLINRSSFTISNETLASIAPLIMAGGVFVGVEIASTTPGGLVTFYDTNGVKTSTLGVVNMGGSGTGSFYIPFEVRVSSGLTYSISGNIAGVTIVYKITRPQ